MTTLIIARHGNTFRSDEKPRRVGSRTDIPLVETGEEQARALGRYLREHNMVPDIVYVSQLQRTQQTAAIALQEAGTDIPLFVQEIFNEVDYGPDENMPEDKVIARLGEEMLAAWDERAILPHGWNFDPAQITENWLRFAYQMQKDHPGKTVLVVTSNGVARFAPRITGDFEGFLERHDIKLATGALAVFEWRGGHWMAKGWNIRP